MYNKVQKLVFVGTRKFNREAHRAVDRASEEREGLYQVNAIECIQTNWFVNYPKVSYDDGEGEGVLTFQKMRLTAADVIEGTDCLVHQSEFMDRNKEAIAELHNAVYDSAEQFLSDLAEKVRQSTHTWLLTLTQSLVKSVGMKEYSERPVIGEDERMRIITGANFEMLGQMPQAHKRMLAIADNAHAINEEIDFDPLVGDGMTDKVRTMFQVVIEYLKTKTQSDLQKVSAEICSIITECKGKASQSLPNIYV